MLRRSKVRRWHTLSSSAGRKRPSRQGTGFDHGEATAASLPGAPPARSQVHGDGGTWQRPMRPAPPGGLHRPAGSQSPSPVVRMRRSTGPRIPHLRLVSDVGDLAEKMPAQPGAALGVPHDPVRCWLLRPRQRSSGGSGSWARRRLGGETEGIPATPEASYPRCHRGPERRCR